MTDTSSMGEIPEDIMEAASAVHNRIMANQSTEATAVLRIARAILAERERTQWRTMDSAPKDGTPFVAVEIWPHEMPPRMYARVYQWVGAPDFWLAKREGLCIRPDYQDRHRWAPLPAEWKVSP